MRCLLHSFLFQEETLMIAKFSLKNYKKNIFCTQKMLAVHTRHVNESIAKIAQLWNSFSQIWNENLKFWNDDYLLNHFVYNMVFSLLNAIRIENVPEHYVNRKIRYSTARTAVHNTKYTVLSWFIFNIGKFPISIDAIRCVTEGYLS